MLSFKINEFAFCINMSKTYVEMIDEFFDIFLQFLQSQKYLWAWSEYWCCVYRQLSADRHSLW